MFIEFHKNVLRLDVSVNDILVVQIDDSFEKLTGKVFQLLWRKRVVFSQIVQK